MFTGYKEESSPRGQGAKPKLPKELEKALTGTCESSVTLTRGDPVLCTTTMTRIKDEFYVKVHNTIVA